MKFSSSYQTSLVLLATTLLLGSASAFNQDSDWKQASSVYEFSAKDIDGNLVELSSFKGHPLIITNVASHCGLTEGNYRQLQALYEKYRESKGLRILAFPCNQFKNQESDPEPVIKDFVSKNFGVTFQMFSKVDVNGDNAHPLFKWLKEQPVQDGENGKDIEWNFVKFFVDKETGKPVVRVPSKVYPEEVEDKLVKLM